MKKYYLLVNPKGGHKRGLEIYEKVKHIFSSAGTNITVLHTEYAGHAFDFANTLDFVGYDGLCAIGGDGTMYELINGMLKRDDNHKIPIGLITGGTGNSFMYDVDCLDPIDAAKRIVQHNLRPLDIAKVNANGELFYSFNIIGWGLATDAGKLAEKLRWLGGVRYDVASIIEVLKGKDRIATLTLDEEIIKEEKIIEESKKNLNDFFEKDGYTFVKIKHEIVNKDNKESKLDLKISISEAMKSFVRRINIVGNTRTLDKVLRRELLILEGDPFNGQKLKDSLNAIKRLGYFKSVDINILKTDAPGVVDIELKIGRAHV